MGRNRTIIAKRSKRNGNVACVKKLKRYAKLKNTGRNKKLQEREKGA